jgi:DNA-binding transcriptional ArsR family regulator
MADKVRRELTDPEALKALAHPLRQRMLARLRRDGPATSAMLAAEYGEDRGATSYHLRQLARYGFVEEDTERSAGRRRYWRTVPADLRLPPPGTGSDEVRSAAETLSALWESEANRLRQRFVADLFADPAAYGEFGPATMSSHGDLRLSAAQLHDFGEEYIALLERWQQVEPGEGARHITALFHAFPTPPEPR